MKGPRADSGSTRCLAGVAEHSGGVGLPRSGDGAGRVREPFAQGSTGCLYAAKGRKGAKKGKGAKDKAMG